MTLTREEVFDLETHLDLAVAYTDMGLSEAAADEYQTVLAALESVRESARASGLPPGAPGEAKGPIHALLVRLSEGWEPTGGSSRLTYAIVEIRTRLDRLGRQQR